MKAQNNNCSGQRFEFGKNWERFLSVLNDDRIHEAEKSLKDMLEIENLKGGSFLDIGSGSGLFSLGAMFLGAKEVISLDYDLESVHCAQELKKRYFPDAQNWTIQQADVLDGDHMKSFGVFDYVYSWGVLMHTGDLWKALEHVAPLVAPKGKLFIAIYNDQGGASKRWLKIKRLYNRMPKSSRFLVLVPCFIRIWSLAMIRDLFRGKPFNTWKNYGKNRGMSPWIDVIDWVGGYPFEVAKPEEIFYFFKKRGFVLDQLKTNSDGGHGNNQFVFVKP